MYSYNIINNIDCQDIFFDYEFDVLQKIADKIEVRNSLSKYYKKAILSSANGRTEEENEVIYQRFCECGKELHIIDNKIKLANFCKNRLCPVCNFVKSNKQWGKIYNHINPENKHILITLTVRNCKGEELSNTIDDMLYAFHKFTNRKKWKRVILGYIRGLEITYNNNADTFHPHIHILCAVSSDYFSDPEKYIYAEDITEWWKTSCLLSYRPDTDIRVVDDEKKGVAEVAKYAVKMADILEGNSISAQKIKSIKTLYKAVFHRRLISSAGIFRTLANIDNILDQEEYCQKLKECKHFRWDNNLNRFTILKM